MPTPLAVAVPALMMVTNAVAGVPARPERLDGKTAATRAGSPALQLAPPLVLLNTPLPPIPA